MPAFGPKPESSPEINPGQDEAINYLESLKSKNFNALLDELYVLNDKYDLEKEGFSDMEHGFFIRLLSSVQDLESVSQNFLNLTFDKFQEFHNFIKKEEVKVEESVTGKYPKESPEVIKGMANQQKRKRHNEMEEQLKSETWQLIQLANRLKSGLDTGKDPLGNEAKRWNELETQKEKDAYIYFLTGQTAEDLGSL